MTEQIQQNLAIEIAEKSLTIAVLKAENSSLRQQVQELTAQLDEATKPKEVANE